MLRADDAAGPADAHPGDGLGGGELVVLHEVAGDERAGASEARLAVHGHRAGTACACECECHAAHVSMHIAHCTLHIAQYTGQ